VKQVAEIAALLAGAASSGSPEAGETRIFPTLASSALEERLDRIRPAIVRKLSASGDVVAQWLNWPNWGNGWNNWPNWGNW
jgi:hypothetical protein